MSFIHTHALARKIKLCLVSPSGTSGEFAAHDDVGRLLVASSRQPLLDACRVLICERVDPNAWIVMRHQGSGIDTVRGKVGVIAKITVAEGDRDAPRFRPWRPFLSRRGSPPMHSNGSSLAASEAAP